MKRSRTGRTIAIAMVFALFVPISACGGGDGGSSKAPSPQPTTSEIVIEGNEFKFAPSDVSFPAGQEVTVTFDNKGMVDHEWAVLRKGTRIASEEDFDESMVLFEIEAIPTKTSATQTFTFEQPGEYQVICALPGHFAAGMEGTLTVS